LTRVWAQRGSRPTQLKQTEYDWIYLYGAVNPLSGDSVALLAPTVNTPLMNHFLRMLSEHVPVDIQVVLALDNAGWHVAKSLRVPHNICLLPLPPYSPELNPIERLWCWLKEHHLSNRVYADYDALLDAGSKAWNCLTPQRIQSVCRTAWLERMD
jgi:transposase